MPEDKQISEQETEEQVFILSNAGKPFKTEHTAQFTLKKKKLEATHEVVPYSDGGFAIREKVDKVD